MVKEMVHKHIYRVKRLHEMMDYSAVFNVLARTGNDAANTGGYRQ
jgi:hypothetical protein